MGETSFGIPLKLILGCFLETSSSLYKGCPYFGHLPLEDADFKLIL